VRHVVHRQELDEPLELGVILLVIQEPIGHLQCRCDKLTRSKSLEAQVARVGADRALMALAAADPAAHGAERSR
jgi:hypothetical protein